jgi:hypothetical protein
MECWASQYSATPFLAFFIGKQCAAARSEQAKARRRRTPETYAVSTLRIPDDRERRDAKLIATALSSVEKFRQPQRHARPDVHESETDTNDDHIRHHAREDLVERHVWRRYPL